MAGKLALIHTVSLVAVFNELCAEVMPWAEVVNVVDEILLRTVLAEGGLSPAICRRVAEHVEAAEQAGADAVLLTCSSISPCADAARLLAGIPVLKVDEPMVRKAVGLGSRIGVVATARTTLAPTTELIRSTAADMGKEVEIIPVLCEDAYEPMLSGDSETHDRIVSKAIKELTAQSDVIVLAQASMARVGETAPGGDGYAVPVLSSPRLAVQAAARVLERR
jgi:Asp/Glu/hydantoin racemase